MMALISIFKKCRGIQNISTTASVGNSAENELATTYIIGRVGNGDYGIALAYCTTLIVLMSLIIGFIQWAVGERKLGRRKTPPAATLVVGA